MTLRLLIIFATACICGTIHNANATPNCLIWNQSPRKRDDYTYTPGIGAHKYYTRPAIWYAARRTCDEEGGHLAIMNSVAEANLLGSLLPEGERVYAHIGFHDSFEEGDYVTIHGESMAKAGFTEWAPGEPWGVPQENCGGLDNHGKLHDMNCLDPRGFMCELSVQ